METKFLNANIIGDPDLGVVRKALELAVKAEPANSDERKKMQGWLDELRAGKKVTARQVTVMAQYLQSTMNDYNRRVAQYKEAIRTISNAV